jgi:hypothetical protein
VDWIEARVAEIRRRTTPADEGSHWSLFFDDPHGAPVIASAVDGAMKEMDESLLRSIARIIAEVPAPACLVAVIRQDGMPRPEDHLMWWDLQLLMRNKPKRLLGFVVIGASTFWPCDLDDDLDTAA